MYIGINYFALLVLVLTGLFFLIDRIPGWHQVHVHIVCPYVAGDFPLVLLGRV